MRIALSHGVSAGSLIVFAGQKTVDNSRRDAVSAQHHRHRRREILAMARLHVEKKISEWVSARSFHFERVGEVCLQVALDCFGGVVTIAGLRVSQHELGMKD